MNMITLFLCAISVIVCESDNQGKVLSKGSEYTRRCVGGLWRGLMIHFSIPGNVPIKPIPLLNPLKTGTMVRLPFGVNLFIGIWR